MLVEYRKSTRIGLIVGTVVVVLAKVISLVNPEAAVPVMLIGAILFIWGCVNYMRGKGHSGWWGALGLFFLIGLIVLLFFPDRCKAGGSPTRAAAPAAAGESSAPAPHQ